MKNMKNKKNLYKASLVSAALIASVGALAGWNSIESNTAKTSEIISTQIEASSASRTYDVDPGHAGVVFSIRHRGVSNFYGQFSTMQGVIHFDKEDIEQTTLELTVPLKSFNTGNTKRDVDIKGAGFLNARQYPEATFTSTSIRELAGGAYAVTGELTLVGKTATVTARLAEFSTVHTNGMDLLGFEADFSIKRSDFGITKYLDPKNPEGGSLGDRIKMTVFVEAVAK